MSPDIGVWHVFPVSQGGQYGLLTKGKIHMAVAKKNFKKNAPRLRCVWVDFQAHS
jgi:hypothetical protein